MSNIRHSIFITPYERHTLLRIYLDMEGPIVVKLWKAATGFQICMGLLYWPTLGPSEQPRFDPVIPGPVLIPSRYLPLRNDSGIHHVSMISTESLGILAIHVLTKFHHSLVEEGLSFS